jgi:hypothetical protein
MMSGLTLPTVPTAAACIPTTGENSDLDVLGIAPMLGADEKPISPNAPTGTRSGF